MPAYNSFRAIGAANSTRSIIVEDAFCRPIGVVILPAVERPKEGNEAKAAQQQSDGDEKKKLVHGATISGWVLTGGRKSCRAGPAFLP